MSSYYTRCCAEHGEWDDDIDNPSECPTCIKEGKTSYQRLASALDACVEALARVEGALISRAVSAWFPVEVRQDVCAALEAAKKARGE